MRKVGFLTVFWTLMIAIPFTALALSVAAYTTTHLGEIATWIANASRATTVGGRGWIIEMAERWPEIAGMVVGQIIILVILILARRGVAAENQKEG